MQTELIVAVISLLGSLCGTFGGIVATGRLTQYRLKKLEDEVRKHNGFAQKMPVIEEQIKIINHRIANLEEMI